MSTITNQTLENVCVKSAESGALECFDQLRIVVDQSASSLDVLVIIFSLAASVVIGFLSVFLAFWGFKISKQAVESAREAAGIAEKANELAASEAEANRKHTENQSMPYMTVIDDIGPEYTMEGSKWQNIIIYVKNIGCGPLIVERLDIYVNEHIVVENNMMRDEAPDFIKKEFQKAIGDTRPDGLQRFFVPINKYPVILNCFGSKSGIAAGDDVRIIEFPVREEFAIEFKTKMIFSAVRINCVYRDIYENEYTFGKILDTSITKN